MVLNEEQWIKELREKRIAYGISQGRLAVASGITREYLNKIESGKMKPSKELLETLHKELARFNPEAPLTMLFDYVKIRFPTLDIQHIIKDILKLNINYMLHEDYGHYSYTEHYSLGDIFIYTSADEEKGVLLELKGRGCRQFESYLLAQQKSWYEMYEMIEELPDYIVECLDEFISHFGTLEEVVEHKDDIYYYPDCETMTDVAYYYIDELQALGDIPPSLQNYIDYEAYGRDLDMGGCFIETSRGMCEIPY